MRALIARRPTAAFLVLLYGAGWALFLPPLLGRSGFGLLPVDLPAQPSILATSLLVLAGGALLVTAAADGRAGARRLAGHLVRFRAGVQWYLLAVLGAPAALLAVALLGRGPAALEPVARHLGEAPVGYLLMVVLIAALVNVWEELGWMAFLTARWQERFGPLGASLLVAPLFGLLHVPLFFVAGALSDAGRLPLARFPEYALYLLVLFSVPVRILVTWVYNATRGSLPVVALLHSSFDTTAGVAVLATFYPGIDGRLLYAALGAAALLVVVLTRGRLGLPSPTATGEGESSAKLAES